MSMLFLQLQRTSQTLFERAQLAWFKIIGDSSGRPPPNSEREASLSLISSWIKEAAEAEAEQEEDGPSSPGESAGSSGRSWTSEQRKSSGPRFLKFGGVGELGAARSFPADQGAPLPRTGCRPRRNLIILLRRLRPHLLQQCCTEESRLESHFRRTPCNLKMRRQLGALQTPRCQVFQIRLGDLA